MATQRIQSTVTAVSWITSEAITGPTKIPIERGVTHYDDPHPDRLVDLAVATGGGTRAESLPSLGTASCP